MFGGTPADKVELLDQTPEHGTHPFLCEALCLLRVLCEQRLFCNKKRRGVKATTLVC